MRIVHQIRVSPRSGYSYPLTSSRTITERDYRYELVRARLRFARTIHRNRLGQMGSVMVPINRSTTQFDREFNTGVRHFSVQDTAATAHVLPKNGLHLVRVSLFGGATTGSLLINYAANKFAHFSIANVGMADYDLDWAVTGNNLASGIFTTDGTAPASWTLTFAETGWGGRSIDDYLAIREAVTAGGAVTTLTNMTAVNFDAGESIPVGIQAYVATAAKPGLIVFPGEPGFQGGVNCQVDSITYPAPITPAPVVKPANSITLAYLAGAAGLLTAYVFYKPTGAK